MLPVLFTVVGIPVQSYGLSKVLAAVVAAWLLGRAFARAGLNKDHAHALVLHATIWGFAGGKVYYLAEHPDQLRDLASPGMWHHLTSGFTWYGGMITGTLAVLLVVRHYRLPLAPVAGMTAAPLSLAYGIGRPGCLLAGDGTYGRPSNLPWAMAFPNGMVPTDVPVQPTPLYESLAAFALAALLWWLGRRTGPILVFAVYLIGSGLARFGVEFLRVNQPVAFGLTVPQMWSLVVVAVGIALAMPAFRHGAGNPPRKVPPAGGPPAEGAESQPARSPSAAQAATPLGDVGGT